MAESAAITVAVDAMSGDHGHEIVVDAVLQALLAHPELVVLLVGDESALKASLVRRRQADALRLEIVHASEVVAMSESPSKALRNKKDSSMRVAIDLVHAGRAIACVSAGNTGALMATAKFVLKTLPGVDRPAIISQLPTLNGSTYVLDLGANAECSAQQLFQFACMGSALVTAMAGIERPSVGLLNIGEEELKGNQVIKDAAAMLADFSALNYVGFVEGDGVFLRPVDVVVCDGFVGNVTLKAGEGVAKLVGHFMREEFNRSWQSKLQGLIARSVLRALARRMDPRRYNGASFVGLRNTVVKSHGSADTVAFRHALEVALHEVHNGVPTRIAALLSSLVPATHTASVS